MTGSQIKKEKGEEKAEEEEKEGSLQTNFIACVVCCSPSSIPVCVDGRIWTGLLPADSDSPVVPISPKN